MTLQTKPQTSLWSQLLTPLAHALAVRTLVLQVLVAVPTAGAGEALKYTSQSVLGPAQESADPDAKPRRHDSKATTFLERGTLTGDWGGLRTMLRNAGITFGLLDQSEGWGNLTGGL